MYGAVLLSVYRRKNINFEELKKSKLIAQIENFLFEDVENIKKGDILIYGNNDYFTVIKRLYNFRFKNINTSCNNIFYSI